MVLEKHLIYQLISATSKTTIEHDLAGLKKFF